VKKRDEIFNMINQDIKKISSLDLSLAENVSSARKVFDPIYQDDNIVKDMVWTKNWMNALNTADSYKGCTDPKKCNGQYWDTGVQALYYRKDEFKNASDADALKFGDVEFTPYVNVHEKAVALAKEAGLNVKQDFNTGQWIITKKNGELVQGGLYNLFSNTLGGDPQIQAMYQTGAYVKRKSFAEEKAAEYGSVDAAEMAYINSMLATGNKSVDDQKTNVSNANDQMSSRRAELLEKQRTTGLTYEELDALNDINEKLPQVQATQDNLKAVSNAINNKTSDDIRSLRSRADAAAAHVLASYDFTSAAQTLALKDAEITMKENPYAMATHQADLSLRNSKEMARINYENKMNEMITKNKLDMERDQFKYQLELGMFDDSFVNPGSTSGGQGSPDIKDDSPWLSTDLTKDENENIVYKRNVETSQKLTNNALDNQKKFLKELYTVANTAKTPGATQAVNNIFMKMLGQKGGKYANTPEGVAKLIDDMASFSPSTLDKFYNNAIQETTKKCPTCDNSWATTFMKENYPTEVINQINVQKQAANAVQAKVKGDIQYIVNSVKGQKPEDYKSDKMPNIYADADLMLKNGYLTDKESFKRAYIAKHKNEGWYKPYQKNIVGGAYGTETKVDRDIVSDAEDAFEKLSDKIFISYNTETSRHIPLDQGYSLKGGGYLGGKSLTYNSVDGAKILSGPTTDARNDFRIFSNNSYRIGEGETPSMRLGFGDPTKENMVDQGGKKEKALTAALQIINRDLQTRWKSGDKSRPVFTYKMSSIAANDGNMSARTIIFNPEYQKKLVGSEKNPGVLYNYKDKLAEGITVYYNNNELKLGSDLASQATNLDYIARFNPEGIKYNYPNGGDVQIKTQEDGSIYATGKTIGYRNGKKVSEAYLASWPQGTKLESATAEVQQKLLGLKNSNDDLDQQAALYNSMGYSVEGYHPPVNNP
jgi:hypothetical protein